MNDQPSNMESLRAKIKECLTIDVPPDVAKYMFDCMKDAFEHMVPEIDIHTIGCIMLALATYWLDNPLVDMPVTLRDICVSLLYVGDRLMTETELEQQYHQ